MASYTNRQCIPFYRVLLVLLLVAPCLWVSQSWAAKINGARIWRAPDNTRLVFDISEAVSFKTNTLKNPDRIFIDLLGASVNTSLDKLNLAQSPINSIRFGRQPNNKLRLVLDLRFQLQAKVFTLLPNETYGHRLVVDLGNYHAQGKQIQGQQAIANSATKKVVKSVDLLNSHRDIMVAIDAGHGGEDPGAMGPKFSGKRLREKHVVLAIAKYLQKEIKKLPGFDARLVRNGDYYVSLRNRTSKARKYGADLFISIHADAFKNTKAKGASVWTLSKRGATSEVGRWLARTENSADLIGGIGGVSLGDQEEDVAFTLLDLSMGHSKLVSSGVAQVVHAQMSQFAHMHKKYVERAGFVVLKSPDIPSILVETGFISNPSEAAKLRTLAYQKKMAKAIATGVEQYFYANPLANTYVAALVEARRKQITYKVIKGDTLTSIASRYGTTLVELLKANDMTSKSVLKVNQKIVIPAS